MALKSLRIGPARFRVGTWQGQAEVAYVAPLSGAATLTPPVLAAMRDSLVERGFRAVVTAALAPAERDRLVGDGYRVRSELIVLSRPLTATLPAPAHSRRLIRRGRSRDLGTVLRVDAAAFAPDWRLGADGFHEARTATPFSRWRVSKGPEVEGYSIAGRAGSQGYLQRLAVLPAQQGRGLGTALVFDALRWLMKGGARSALVNTQPENEQALAFYRRCGFVAESEPLTVLHRDLR